MRRIYFLPLIVALSGCAPTLVQMSLAPADATLATSMLERGTSTLKGSALLRQRGGGVVTCAGNEVYLIPGTSSATNEFRRVFGDDKGYVERGGDPIMGGGKLVIAPQPNRKSQCNAQGFFTFADIRPGKWYVMTNVIWTVGDQRQGGTLLGSADVAEGREIEIVLSQ